MSSTGSPPTTPEGPPQPPPRAPRPDPPPGAAPWPIWTVPAAIVTGLGAGFALTALVEVIGAVGGSSVSHPSPAVNIFADIAFDLGFVLAAIWFAVRTSRPTPADFGFRWPRPGRALRISAAAAFAYYVLTAVYASLLNLHGNEKLPNELGNTKHAGALIAAAAFVCVIAPIAEEFFFRGFLFGALRRMRIQIAGREVGTWVAAVIVGVLFGLVHSGSAPGKYLLPLGFLGFVLCLVRWRTDSLYPCMALHSINNSLALGVNQLGWNAIEITGLMVGALALIAAITGPLAQPRLRAG